MSIGTDLSPAGTVNATTEVWQNLDERDTKKGNL
jgi:hypothetical protein